MKIFRRANAVRWDWFKIFRSISVLSEFEERRGNIVENFNLNYRYLEEKIYQIFEISSRKLQGLSKFDGIRIQN